MRVRKRIEEAFGWMKTIAGLKRPMLRGIDHVGWAFTFVSFACRGSWLKRADRPIWRAYQPLHRSMADHRNDVWSKNVLDLVEKAQITFEGTCGGEIAFVAVKGFLDVRYGSRQGATYAEFSWQGFDDTDETCGRGWATIGNDDRLIGHTSSYIKATTQPSSANANDSSTDGVIGVSAEGRLLALHNRLEALHDNEGRRRHTNAGPGTASLGT
jgi:hypothetical protein